MRQGRVYVGFTTYADPTGFRFDAFDSKNRNYLAGIGDELPVGEGLVLRVSAPAPGKIVIIKDGHPFAEGEGRTLEVLCDAPGVYRAEVWVSIGGRMLPWILGSPIYVRANPLYQTSEKTP